MSIKFQLPEPPTEDKDDNETCCAIDDMRWMRRVDLPINKEMLGKLNVGDKVKVVLEATVTGLEMRQRDESVERNEVSLDLSSVELPSEKNDFESMLEEDE